ncbi:TPA: hypothetical protein MPJ72_002340 [Enterobacter asburiae]|nr:hypothetical protein MC67_24105 [Enterobacter cloacae complex sp.]EJY4123610.1 hypothetical protein [Enterobacter asburiae]EKZ3170702.1 hypothetical protein [Enterobacter asburiae]ELC7395321.1 hypothetical protein [Enterobacter asburiae]KUQ24362.1 hypothetical protein AWI12_17590 [Enterobacter asburiae]
MEHYMQINRGTIWHTYTTQSPEYTDTEKFGTELINTGLFLSILTPDNTFSYIANSIPTSTKIELRYENNDNGVSVIGFDKIQNSGTCVLTANALNQCINIRLSERKLFHTLNNDYYENIICCLKPIIVKNNNIELFIYPIIRLYKNGISHVTFIDAEERSIDLEAFIKNVLSLPFELNHSITTSIEFAVQSLLLDYSGMSLLNRHKLKDHIKNSMRLLIGNSKEMEINGSIITGKYVDYANSLQIQHNLSDIARYLIAIIFNTINKKNLKSLLFGNNTSDFYNFWQGKPNVYIFEHENQKNSASENAKENEKLVFLLLGKSHLLANKKQSKEYIDHRAFDDYNFYSEQGLALTLLSSGINNEYFKKEYTEENLKWDNQIKSELRDYISFFYESKINKIENEKTHLGLAKIQEDILLFEEWLRIFSRKYGEIQDFVLKTKNSEDIKIARKSVIEIIKSRMQVIKLIDADRSEKGNNKITMAFGLIASTSLSPVIVKPLFETFKLSAPIKSGALKNYEDAIYFFTSIFFIWLIIKIINFRNK